jgi:putative N6-adenine-specific DNA methylase
VVDAAIAPTVRGGGVLDAPAHVVTAPRRRDCYVVAAPGLESLVSAELMAIGIPPGERERGGVAFAATDDELFTANLHLRTASRVLVRIAQFRATAFHELQRLSGGVPWERFVVAGAAVRLRVTCHKSRLYHSDGVAERVTGAIMKRVNGVAVTTIARDVDEAARDSAGEHAAQLFVVRFDHDVCTISADSSGELLHRRGYRKATAKAPLRETLAAATLLALEWDGTAPLADPMCGAGTITIEGALIARRIAPGIGRTFACERWPGIAGISFAALRDAARERERSSAPTPIVASDRDAGAIEAARANAERAGVLGDITFATRALSSVDAPGGKGLLVTNPPYGRRVGERKELRSLYAQLGKLARTNFAEWKVGMLSADRMLEGQTGVRFEEVLRFSNGGIPVRVVRGKA